MGIIASECRVVGKTHPAKHVVTVEKVRLEGIVVELVHEDRREGGILEAK